MSDLRAVEAEVKRIQAGVSGFAADMHAQGIHVGMGSPPRCVTCGEAWPCKAAVVELRDRDRADG